MALLYTFSLQVDTGWTGCAATVRVALCCNWRRLNIHYLLIYGLYCMTSRSTLRAVGAWIYIIIVYVLSRPSRDGRHL